VVELGGGSTFLSDVALGVPKFKLSIPHLGPRGRRGRGDLRPLHRRYYCICTSGVSTKVWSTAHHVQMVSKLLIFGQPFVFAASWNLSADVQIQNLLNFLWLILEGNGFPRRLSGSICLFQFYHQSFLSSRQPNVCLSTVSSPE
jgi:hypothetical protein